MINREEINMEIARLEFEESSYPNYYKLAALYAIRDQQDKSGNTGYSFAAAPAIIENEPHTNSDFLRAVKDKPANQTWEIMDELMDTLKTVNRRVYDRIMEKIQEL